MNTRTRKALGCFVLLAYLALYAALAATLGTYVLAHTPNWAALIYYVVAGVVWVAPLKPLFDWMNRAP
jgi:predicted membrane channel-forming protein YqfA (hemolysin III family)